MVVKTGTYTHVLKIRFAETNIADKALTHGFVGFNLSVQLSQIQRETYTNLLICFSCYKWEDHVTTDCPDKHIKLCSNCAMEGHIWKECPTAEARNCCKREGRSEFKTHRTMAMAFPIKKRKMREKLDEEKQKEEDKRNASYASVAKQTFNLGYLTKS